LHATDPQADRANESTLTGEVPGQWSSRKPSRISKSFLLQSRHADGASENLQRLVRNASGLACLGESLALLARIPCGQSENHDWRRNATMGSTRLARRAGA